MNYGELKTLVEFYIHRTDLAPYWDQIFEQVRQNISANARLMVMEKNVTISVNDFIGDLPADFIEFRDARQAAARGNQPLQFYTRGRFEDMKRGYSNGFYGYTISGGQIEVAKNIDVAGTYYARPSPLVGNQDTNPVLENWPSLYIFGAQIYANNILQDTETEQVARGHYENELMAANDADEKARRSGDAPTMVAR